MSQGVEVTVIAHTPAPVEVAFDVVVPIDLASIFERWLVLPGVAGVRDQSGPWDAAGRSRTVLLDDGTAVPELLTAVNRPHSFSYRVGPFPGSLGALVSAAEGRWSFGSATDGSTEIGWSYRFLARPGRRLLVRFLVAPLWRGYARRALRRAVTVVEASAGVEASLPGSGQRS